MTIDWTAFVVVVLVAVLTGVAVVALVAAALRLRGGARPARALGIACYVVAVAIVLAGLYLLIPAFH